MWMTGNGTFPKNALRQIQRSEVESLPIDQSIPMLRKRLYASRTT